ncbi:hypothetical protein AB2V43_004444 [Salmonella enterica]|nr:LuxR family transcriptional regulator [Salmonella enterica]
MMHIFTTTRNAWLMRGLREIMRENGTNVRVYCVESAGELFGAAGHRLPTDSVLLPVFPDNHPVDCLRSLTFLGEWLSLRHRMQDINVPCILWGNFPLIRCMPEAASLTVMPWRISPAALRHWLLAGMVPRPVPRGPTFVPGGVHLTPREVAILYHTLEGCTLKQIAKVLGVDPGAVWVYRRNAMNALGIRRLHDLMQLPPEVFCEPRWW